MPLTVAVDVYQKPLIEVLRDIGLQAGTRADVAVDAQNGVIELSYAAVGRIRGMMTLRAGSSCLLFAGLALGLALAYGGPAYADATPEVSPPPPIIQELQEQQSGADGIDKSEVFGLQIRKDALREAALLSYGVRGGLAYRTFEIQRRLAEYDTSLSKTFPFARLLIAAPSGLLIEPPIVSEAQRAVIVNGGGQASRRGRPRLSHQPRGAYRCTRRVTGICIWSAIGAASIRPLACCCRRTRKSGRLGANGSPRAGTQVLRRPRRTSNPILTA